MLTKCLKKMDFSKSEHYWSRAIQLIPTGTQTLSKTPSQFAAGLTPKFIEYAEGPYMWDVDGNRFIDYAGALGPIILGYNHPVVKEAIKRQLEKGIIFSLASPMEIELAEILTGIIPSAQMVRYGKNGNDVTSAAIRVARAYTGRDKIAICGYHGWQDWYIVTTARNYGVPPGIKDFSHTFTYNDIASLEKVFTENKDEIAAVIMEPVGVIEPVDGFLGKVKKLANDNGALLIFDEVKSGFRCHIGGAQSLYGVVPDMSCFGKAMANGMPMSALVGSAKVMKTCEKIFYSIQAGGELLSIAASIATINELKKTDAITKVRQSGELLIKGCRDLIQVNRLEDYVEIQGLPHYTVFNFKGQGPVTMHKLKTLFIQEAMKRSIFCGGYSILSLSHTPDVIKETLSQYEAVFEIIRDAVNSNDFDGFLQCPVVSDVFRRV